MRGLLNKLVTNQNFNPDTVFVVLTTAAVLFRCGERVFQAKLQTWT